MSNPTTTSDIEARITEYLAAGGLFNPEYANHDAVRDLLIDCRAALAAEREAVEQYKVAFENANDTCSTLRKHLATAIEALKEIANSNEDNQYLSKVAEDALAKIGEK